MEKIIVVTGLPRSGTSMMMQMLKNGGIPILTDEVRKPDEDNPYGYYEFEKVKELKKDSSWIDNAKGKAVKIITELLYYLPKDKKYFLIFMERNVNEIVKSQRAMLERKGQIMKYSEDEMKLLYKKHLQEIKEWLKEQDNFITIFVSYNEVINNPQNVALKIQEFLGIELDIDKMIKSVDPTLYRHKSLDLEGLEEKNISAKIEKKEKEKIIEQLEMLGYL